MGALRDCLESPDGHQSGATQADIEGQGDRIFALQASDLASLTPLQPSFQTVSLEWVFSEVRRESALSGVAYTSTSAKKSVAPPVAKFGMSLAAACPSGVDRLLPSYSMSS